MIQKVIIMALPACDTIPVRAYSLGLLVLLLPPPIHSYSLTQVMPMSVISVGLSVLVCPISLSIHSRPSCTQCPAAHNISTPLINALEPIPEPETRIYRRKEVADWPQTQLGCCMEQTMTDFSPTIKLPATPLRLGT